MPRRCISARSHPPFPLFVLRSSRLLFRTRPLPLAGVPVARSTIQSTGPRTQEGQQRGVKRAGEISDSSLCQIPPFPRKPNSAHRGSSDEGMVAHPQYPAFLQTNNGMRAPADPVSGDRLSPGTLF